MLHLHENSVGGSTALHPTLIWDDEAAVLIDTGMPGSWERIRTAMLEAGVSPAILKAVILTHQDFDHIGSVPEIIAEAEQAKVYAHKLDQPYIEGTLPLIKTSPEAMAPLLEMLPEEERQKAIDFFGNPPKAKVDHTLDDGDELPYGGGIRVIHTPGHTDGHISLYLVQSKTLVAGDALICVNGTLQGPVARTTLDMEEARRSLAKLLDYEIESVICYHGGRSDQNVKGQLEQLAQRDPA
ncbi:MBL fold metallo-hydrolase [Brevibacillus borstelensis]|jgi:glyoxylase-like metal-dependent hydrolase (beta-lactamase superfamily II)|nr:MBL fold metallo-hydrolase [Brevibacillus borstelensis]KKX55294.1 hydrolase [Brevibacillus borstelensis cifa_chp40]MBE5396896.1 MBL fold metallo-hydrolase [Brevibacillus borstelensis]MCC0563861.1 MBL fold metallo-hydrolase [Brevibacillus borstelensis]MCM3472010.1 MBL fold metallo-hydrolase [Brevibacillus borstelensis]MCM3560194.1 MBL fold metallo-hydrolase [Brevibacillus borstelensis]